MRVYIRLLEFFLLISPFKFTGLITGYLADKISIRWTVIFGAVVSLAGFTISAFGPKHLLHNNRIRCISR